MHNKSNITGIVLAGGKSSRMGTDKALIRLNNQSFLEHVIYALKPLVDDILIISNNPNHRVLGYSRIPDLIVDAGPLAGLHAGLNHSQTENNLVLSCDVPLIQTSVLEFIIANNEEDKDVIQLEDKGRPIPLVALYKKRVAPYFFSLLNQGERTMRDALTGLNTKTLSLSKEQQVFVKNINTISDLNNIANEN